jgi:hypothetical protein
LQNPTSTLKPGAKKRSKSQRQSHGRDELQKRRLQEGSDVTVMPPSPVRDGPGFHPRKIALGMRRPQQGKRHPWASPSPSLSLRAHSTASSRNPRDTTSCLHHHRCPVVPHNDEEYGACRHQHHPTLAQATRQTRGGPAAVIPTDCASLSAHQRLVCSWGIRLVGCGRMDLEITFRILLHVELRLDLCFVCFTSKLDGCSMLHMAEALVGA